MNASSFAARFATTTAMTIATATLALAVATRSSAQDSAAPAAGPFTAAQAAHGKAVFAQQCASCHGANLEGQAGPPLAGATFLGSWKGRSVADLNDQIASTMPLSNPGSVTGKDLTDVVAYILSAQGVSPGTTELPGSHDALAKLVITGK